MKEIVEQMNQKKWIGGWQIEHWKNDRNDRLLLRPGKNITDDEPFITMLRKDGDFKDFCGLDFSERYLEGFRNYFELDNNCIYSIYPRTTERFIGYVGVHCEPKCSDYEIEFYTARDERRKGYCFEASTALID